MVKSGLRPLAVHLSNGWNSELAVDNIRKAIEGLGIDLHTHVINWNEFKDLQLLFPEGFNRKLRSTDGSRNHGVAVQNGLYLQCEVHP